MNMTQSIRIDSTEKVLIVGEEAILSSGGNITFNRGDIEGFTGGGSSGKRLVIRATEAIKLEEAAGIALEKTAIIGENI